MARSVERLEGFASTSLLVRGKSLIIIRVYNREGTISFNQIEPFFQYVYILLLSFRSRFTLVLFLNGRKYVRVTATA